MTVDENREKLKHLIGHWIDHNRFHEASYIEWAEKAKAMGEGKVAEYIEMAVEQMREADEFLISAKAEMK
jgi:hypothetical protein